MAKDKLYEQMQANIECSQTANKIGEESNEKLTYNQKINICLPAQEKRITINYSDVEKLDKHCNMMKKRKYNCSELFLSSASLFLGAFLSAIISGINFNFTFISIMSYCICPTLGSSLLVAYFMIRSIHKNDEKALAEKVQEYIIEPAQKSIEEGEEG